MTAPVKPFMESEAREVQHERKASTRTKPDNKRKEGNSISSAHTQGVSLESNFMEDQPISRG